MTPAQIYAESFAIIRREAALGHLPAELHAAAERMIHACGMIDLAEDIVGDPALPEAVRAALARGAKIYCDSEMVRAGLIGHAGIVTLNDPRVTALAEELGTTRSAAAAKLWDIPGSVVIIGNAPTALMQLLDKPQRPAAVIGIPVGFVGAAESKARLEGAGIPYLTVRGRRGGSAIAAAAFNAIAGATQ